VEVRALTDAEAAVIAGWRYPGAYSTYDFDDPSVLASDHWAVTDSGELLGYCCFGAPARVAGADAEPGRLDLGYGLAPGSMGRGHGRRVVAAVLDFARRRFDSERIRLFILEWNERSSKVAAQLGFATESVVVSDEDRFLVMVRHECGADSPSSHDVCG
jgi:[ribosomal protein S18]-alanine N-acetyltransferase